MEILERILIAISVLGAFWLLLRIANSRQLATSTVKLAGLEGLQDNRLGVLYFTTPDCMPCQTVQRPALQRLQQAMDTDLQVIEINAAEQTDLADEWGVLSIPTTFLIDRNGEPRKINRGVTRYEKLVSQFQALDEKIA